MESKDCGSAFWQALPDEEMGRVTGGTGAQSGGRLTASVTGYVTSHICPQCGNDIWGVGNGGTETSGDTATCAIFYQCAACAAINGCRQKYGLPEQPVPRLPGGVNPSLSQTSVTITFRL
ncbi:MAG TPA: hypothetical protein VN366_04315 [Feifaniaceae bacterium]|nr:hypothetical protein [Feifaniaceae bacterium]